MRRYSPKTGKAKVSNPNMYMIKGLMFIGIGTLLVSLTLVVSYSGSPPRKRRKIEESGFIKPYDENERVVGAGSGAVPGKDDDKKREHSKDEKDHIDNASTNVVDPTKGAKFPPDRVGYSTQSDPFNKCPVVRTDSFYYSHDGQRCIFPYKTSISGEWVTGPQDGKCATTVTLTGVGKYLANVTNGQTISEDQVCIQVENPRTCSGDRVDDVDCHAIIETGTCVCKGKLGITRGFLECRRMSCEAVCRNIFEDYMSTSHSVDSARKPLSYIDYVTTLAKKHTPEQAAQWKEFVDALPPKDEVTGQWCGKGIAFMAGSVGTLPQAIAAVSFIRGHLISDVPVEIWQTEEEATDHSPDFIRGLDQLNIRLRTLPSEVKSSTVDEMFALKPAVILASSFDVVLFLDADALPLVDPLQIFQQRQKSSAVFWPDYWTLLYDAKIWESIDGGWPYPDHVAASQDSGLMVVCKSCGAWKPLTLAFYFNYHNNIYYPAIYTGHFSEKQCRASKCNSGHTVPGIGDKDTFQIAWRALKEPYYMMPPSALGGTMLPKRSLLCGTSFLHKSRNGATVAIHHNSNKWWYRDFVNGKWATSKTGFLLTHSASYVNDETAYHADGINQWRSVTYSGRYDAGKQAPPAGARWCIIYKGDVRTATIEAEMGWDIETVLLNYYSRMYSVPWMAEWALTELSKDTAIQKCLRKQGWASVKDIDTLREDNLRNIVISMLHTKGYGKVNQLQARSDGKLSEICLKHRDGS
eukprot:TRINITY_DN11131_c0_g1_i1.p1 TRINITY_DN11131_c0_g1~~TRINITY_DN11131_c0_g1_i1.p1  ORF type:complete len:750 (+),score=182.55 TRINITY_DN11131_c0_g1_i1:44-2293(+)